ncbi:MAG: hypothetical protein AAGF11_53315 [Myxococcota bacterium]
MAGFVAAGLAWLEPFESSPEPPTVMAPQITEPARALLGGLAAGDALVGWTVEALDGPTEGVVRVDLRRDDVRFALMVAARGSRSERPPVQTERYAIFYGHVRPTEITLPAGTIRATTHALARRVQAHELEVEVPGMVPDTVPKGASNPESSAPPNRSP